LHNSLKPYTTATKTKKREGTCFQGKRLQHELVRLRRGTTVTPSTTPKLLHSINDLNGYGTPLKKLSIVPIPAG